MESRTKTPTEERGSNIRPMYSREGKAGLKHCTEERESKTKLPEEKENEDYPPARRNARKPVQWGGVGEAGGQD